MKRGCIVISAFNCDECGSVMEHGERYLLVSEEDESSKKKRICVTCAENQGMASYIIEKGEHVLTFFGDDVKAGEGKGKPAKIKEPKGKEVKTKESKEKEPKAKATKKKEAKVKVKAKKNK